MVLQKIIHYRDDSSLMYLSITEKKFLPNLFIQQQKWLVPNLFIFFKLGHTVKLLNKCYPFCRAFMATIEGWPLLRGFIELKITGLCSCQLALIQGLALVQGDTIEGFHCTTLLFLSFIWALGILSLCHTVNTYHSPIWYKTIQYNYPLQTKLITVLSIHYR